MLILYLSDDKIGAATQFATECITGTMSIADTGCQTRTKYSLMEYCSFDCSWVPLGSCASTYGRIRSDVWQNTDRRVAEYSQTTYDKIQSGIVWQDTVRQRMAKYSQATYGTIQSEDV